MTLTIGIIQICVTSLMDDPIGKSGFMAERELDKKLIVRSRN